MIDIVQAVIDTLYMEFGDEVLYVAEDYEQGLKEPCFLISIIQDGIITELSGSGWYNAVINIVYLQETENRLDKLDKKMRIFSILENIEINGQKIYAHSIESNSDRELNIIVEYITRVQVRENEQKLKMKEIEQERYDG